MLTHCVRVPASFLVRNGSKLFVQIPRNQYSKSPLRARFVVPCNFHCHDVHVGSCGFSTSRETLSSDIGKTLIGLKTDADMEDFVGHLSTEQKALLLNYLTLDTLRHKKGDSGDDHPYLSKLGRPSTHPQNDDPRGFSQMAPTWLIQPMPDAGVLGAEEDVQDLNDETSTVPPSLRDIWGVGLKNALPFVGFGFLDNLIMILAGDYIDVTIGTALGISTMAAAALGNTISDVAGIASAWYVEKFAEKFGIHEPVLTAFQRRSWQIRWVTTLGRAIGVVIGCLLGMIPLIFLPSSADKREQGSSTGATVE